MLLRTCQQNSTVHTTCGFSTFTAVIQKPQVVSVDRNLYREATAGASAIDGPRTSLRSFWMIEDHLDITPEDLTLLLEFLCRSTALE